MDMTIMVILKTIYRLLHMTIIMVTLKDLSKDLGESPQNKIITTIKDNVLVNYHYKDLSKDLGESPQNKCGRGTLSSHVLETVA